MGTLIRLGGTLERSGTVSGCFSGLPVPPFNAIHAWYDDDDVDADVRALVAHGEDRNLPMVICVQVGAPHEPKVEAVARQLVFAGAGEPQAAMVLVDSDVPPLPDGVVCSSPADAEDLGVIADLMAVFGLPGGITRAAAHPDTLDWDDVEWFTLWDGDAAVASSMLIQVGAHRSRDLGAVLINPPGSGPVGDHLGCRSGPESDAGAAVVEPGR